jgi:hypothetical protein
LGQADAPHIRLVAAIPSGERFYALTVREITDEDQGTSRPRPHGSGKRQNDSQVRHSEQKPGNIPVKVATESYKRPPLQRWRHALRAENRRICTGVVRKREEDAKNRHPEVSETLIL